MARTYSNTKKWKPAKKPSTVKQLNRKVETLVAQTKPELKIFSQSLATYALPEFNVAHDTSDYIYILNNIITQGPSEGQLIGHEFVNKRLSLRAGYYGDGEGSDNNVKDLCMRFMLVWCKAREVYPSAQQVTAGQILDAPTAGDTINAFVNYETRDTFTIIYDKLHTLKYSGGTTYTVSGTPVITTESVIPSDFLIMDIDLLGRKSKLSNDATGTALHLQDGLLLLYAFQDEHSNDGGGINLNFNARVYYTDA